MVIPFKLKTLFSSSEKVLTILLGIFWLVDGILQFQSGMFTQVFVGSILVPNLSNQPIIVAQLIYFGIHVFKMNTIAWNLLFSFVQILLGILLVLPISTKWHRFALWASIPWILTVWIFGEGFGNLFTGSASFYTGAPGSAFLYLILTIFLLFPEKLLLSYLPRVVGLLCLFGALLNQLQMFWIKGMQSMLYQMSKSDSSAIISFPAKILSHIAVSTLISNLVAILLLSFFGILLLVRPTRLVGWLTIIFLFLVWWISQDFGGIFTFPQGTATDPNSAPILMLFLVPLFVNAKSNKRVKKT